MGDLKAGIFVQPYVIDVIRRLLGGFDIFRANGGEFDRLVGRREHFNEIRQHPFNDFVNVVRNDLRTAFYFIPERFRIVKFHRLLAFFGDFAAQISHGGLNLVLDERLQLVLRHSGHIGSISRKYHFTAGVVIRPERRSRALCT